MIDSVHCFLAVHYFDHGYLEEDKSMLHTCSFTVTFGAKYLTGMVTSVPPYDSFSLIKNLCSSSVHKLQKSLRKFKFLRYVTFRSRDAHIHKYAVHINGDF